MLLLFIAVLFVRPGDFFEVLADVPIAKTLTGISVMMVLAGKLIRRDLSIAKSHYNPWMGALTFAVIVSALHSSDRSESMIFFNNVYVKIVVVWFLMMETIDTRRRTVAFQVTIAVMTGCIAAYSIWAKFTATNLIEGSRSAFVGLLADPNDLAMTLLMSVPFLVEATLSPKMRLSRPLWLLLLLLHLGGLIATQSRGGLLGLGAGLFVLMKMRIQSWTIVAAICAAGLAALVTVAGIGERQTTVSHQGGMDASAQGRIDAWIAGARMLAYNPITGVGLFTVHTNYSAYAVNPVDWRPKTSHNAFVQCAAETGLLGITPFVTLVLLAAWSGLRLLREIPHEASPLERAFLRSQLATHAAVMVAAFFLSVAWSWFFYIIVAQLATSHRVWLTMPEVLESHRAATKVFSAERTSAIARSALAPSPPALA